MPGHHLYSHFFLFVFIFFLRFTLFTAPQNMNEYALCSYYCRSCWCVSLLSLFFFSFGFTFFICPTSFCLLVLWFVYFCVYIMVLLSKTTSTNLFSLLPVLLYYFAIFAIGVTHSRRAARLLCVCVVNSICSHKIINDE